MKGHNMKEITGEKYTYLAMAYILADQKGGKVTIGKDNGMTGGQNFYRYFYLHPYKGGMFITEVKISAHFVEFTRTFKVIMMSDRLHIYEYIDENRDNLSKNWRH